MAILSVGGRGADHCGGRRLLVLIMLGSCSCNGHRVFVIDVGGRCGSHLVVVVAVILGVVLVIVRWL